MKTPWTDCKELAMHSIGTNFQLHKISHAYEIVSAFLLNCTGRYMAHYAEDDHGSYIPVDSNFMDGGHDESDIHIASPAEKQRIWWRSAAINACFIASWYVNMAFWFLKQV